MSNAMLTDGMIQPWDYLIVTASNDSQARAYSAQLALRRELGLLPDIGEVLVVADPGGKRVGSGGSTLFCLMQILNRETAAGGGWTAGDWTAVENILRRLRILIIHAGGDSRRLPAYGPCGKIFVPVPGESDSALGTTLFDRQLETFLRLPAAAGGGQVVVTSGDALIRFDPGSVRLDQPGLTALGCPATPEHASKHGVFCPAAGGTVRLFLQKPRPDAQQAAGAVNRYGQAILDIGIMSFDIATAVRLLQSFPIEPDTGGGVRWAPPVRELMLSKGLDIYREVCCALGSEATAAHHLAQCRASGSAWDEAELARLHAAISPIPFNIQVVPQCGFLHFGTTRQLISSGLELLQADSGAVPAAAPLEINDERRPGAALAGRQAWVEGCRIAAPLTLAENNVVVGVDVTEPLALPAGACLDVLAGRSRAGQTGWFVRCYDIADTFKDPLGAGGTLCGIPLERWLAAAGLAADEVWGPEVPANRRTLWDARIFPIEKDATGYRRWLWMFNPAEAAPADKQALRAADRYSVAEMATLADQDDFYGRRAAIRAEAIRGSVRRMFRKSSEFSAAELAYALRHARDRGAWVAEVVADAYWHVGGSRGGGGMESLVFCRIMHSLGAAVEMLRGGKDLSLEDVLPGLGVRLAPEHAAWLAGMGLAAGGAKAAEWAARARAVSFERLHGAILGSALSAAAHPRNVLRSDETIWGRAPARLELGGGWTDTPPYTLEYGGSVANVAIDLNGQPPIHVYGRVVRDPVIRLSSIDVGAHVEVRELEELLDYRRPGDGFALVKAALAISGFSPEMAQWPSGTTLRKMLEEFGGGIELTTLVGIPKGSGLGTSSILGATLIAVIQRMLGRQLTQRELFHNVLRLEQALTTGGGWQDQIGGGVGGTKITTTEPGLFPDPRIHYLPNDLLDPALNGGSTLLYYTGITRLAKNILEQVVGGYLNRERRSMAVLRREHEVARSIAEAMARKDVEALGRAIDAAWRLHMQLCGDVTNPQIEELRRRIRPHIFGARILGAGSGGFMLMVGKSPEHAAKIREMLEREPLNERARFFAYQINHAGLVVTAC